MTRSPVHGVSIVDKPRGCTSFDVVAQARRVFGTRSVGHAGTLDPMATGVLVLLLGEATKLSALLTANDKTYEAELCFGRGTDSFDADGNTTFEQAGAVPSAAALTRAFEVERARTLQVPPAHSAVKVEGRRAYTFARRGAPLELAPREVSVRRLEAHPLEGDKLRVSLTVSKGYYVRAFARDLCESLGVPGHLSALRRTASGVFTIEEAVAWPPTGAVPPPLPVAAAASRALPHARLTEAGALRARQGKVLLPDDFHEPPGESNLHAWLDDAGALVALGERVDDGYRVRRGFAASVDPAPGV